MLGEPCCCGGFASLRVYALHCAICFLSGPFLLLLTHLLMFISWASLPTKDSSKLEDYLSSVVAGNLKPVRKTLPASLKL